MFVGSCMIKRWPSTQKAIALSSAEAELDAATRGFSKAKVYNLWLWTSARIFATRRT